MKIISWNVNGLRAVLQRGFLEWFRSENPEILCLQETKAEPSQLPAEVTAPEHYQAEFAWAQKKGYSGVALYSRDKPQSVRIGMGLEKFDREGRLILAEYPDFTLLNVYFPNGKMSPERLAYKLEFYETLLGLVRKLKRQGHEVILTGDVNTAHREIDLARPRENAMVSGFLPEERAWIDKLLRNGFLDSFRLFNREPGQYTWWDYQTRARERNVGWRIDYFFITENLRPRIRSAGILSQVMGSDHCPISLELT